MPGVDSDRDGTPRDARAVTVIICAYTMERWNDLVRAVESARPRGEGCWEIVVVVDHDDELAASASAAFSRLRGVSVVRNDQEPGLSGARNTGVRAASGEIIAFLDDDAEAGPTWVTDLVAHYRDPLVYGVGGSASPVWVGGDRPRWFPREFDWVVGCGYPGQPVRAEPVRNLLGCNMSFRREVFDLVGGFDPVVGRIGKRPLGCEETELCIRLRQRSPEAKLVFDPAVVVRHHVSPDRRRFGYFRGRCYAEGLSKAMVVELAGSESGLASERSYVWRVLPRGFLAGFWQALTLRPWGLVRSLAIALGLCCTLLGYVRGRGDIRRPRHAASRPIRT